MSRSRSAGRTASVSRSDSASVSPSRSQQTQPSVTPTFQPVPPAVVSFKLTVSAIRASTVFDEGAYHNPNVTAAEQALLLAVVTALRNDAGCFAGLPASMGVKLVAITDFALARDDLWYYQEDPVNGPLAPTACPSVGPAVYPAADGSAGAAGAGIGVGRVLTVTRHLALRSTPSMATFSRAPHAARHARRAQFVSGQSNATGVQLSIEFTLPSPAFNATLAALFAIVDNNPSTQRLVDVGINELHAEYTRQANLQKAAVDRLQAFIAGLVTPAYVETNPTLNEYFRNFIRECVTRLNLDIRGVSVVIKEPAVVTLALSREPPVPPTPSPAPARSPPGPSVVTIIAAASASLCALLLVSGVCYCYCMRQGSSASRKRGAAVFGALTGATGAVAAGAVVGAQVMAIGIGSAVVVGIQAAASVDPVLGPLASLISIAHKAQRQLQTIEQNNRHAAAVRDRLAILMPMLERATAIPEFEAQYATLIECTRDTFNESEAFLSDFVKEAQPGVAQWCIRLLRASTRLVELDWLSSSLSRHIQDLTAAVAVLAAGAGSRDAAEHRAALERMAQQHAADMARLRSILLQPRSRGDALATLVERSIGRAGGGKSLVASDVEAAPLDSSFSTANPMARVRVKDSDQLSPMRSRGGLLATSSGSAKGDPASLSTATSSSVSARLMSGQPPRTAAEPASPAPPASPAKPPAGAEAAGPGSPVAGAGTSRSGITAALHLIELQQLDLRTSVVLGRGAYGRVRSALWSNIDVAVKEIVLDEGDAIPGGVVAEFHREIALHWSLRHPHVVSVYGSIEDLSRASSPLYGIVMERMDRSLYAALRRPEGSPLALADRVRICLEVATGLAYLHGKDVIHADLKSLNVLLDAHNTAKLSDFGLSSLHDPAVSSLLTKTRGGPVGTPLWMAPELFSDPSQGGHPGRPTPQSDVFALGITLWEALAGEAPYAHLRVPNLSVVLPALVCDGTRPSLELLPVQLPPSVAALLRRLWDGDPQQRGTAQAAVDSLRSAASFVKARVAASATKGGR